MGPGEIIRIARDFETPMQESVANRTNWGGSNAHSSHMPELNLLARLCKAHCWVMLNLCPLVGGQDQKICRRNRMIFGDEFGPTAREGRTGLGIRRNAKDQQKATLSREELKFEDVRSISQTNLRPCLGMEIFFECTCIYWYNQRCYQPCYKLASRVQPAIQQASCYP
jgi:hypothetical protein